jgi:uncharacterized protein YraI
MKRAIIIFLFLLVSGNLFATADGPDFYQVNGVKADDQLNIRTTPSSSGKIVGTIPPNGKKIENLGEFYPPANSDMDLPKVKWCKIKYNKVEGWVYCKYLVEDSSEE